MQNSLGETKKQTLDRIRAENRAFRENLTTGEFKERLDGSFFASFDEVCAHSPPLTLVTSNFPNIQRTEEQGLRIYPNTAKKDFLDEFDEATSSKSDSTNTDQTRTSVDFLFNPTGEKAHLLSNAPLCHLAYSRLVQAAAGCFPGDSEKCRKLLNGMKRRSRRLNDSGIKHSKFNKMHLFQQKDYLDSTPPSLIVVPILTIEKVKDWDPTSEFDALVLPCGDLAEIAAGTVLLNCRQYCTEEEVRIAVNLLHTFVKDIAESLLDVQEDILEDVADSFDNTNDASVRRWTALVRELRGAHPPAITAPTLKNNVDWDKARVAKGRFSFSDSCLPDPFLVAMKGAINYSSFTGRKLMPACAPRDSSD